MNECLEIEYLFGFICNWYCLVLFIIFWVSDSDMYFSFILFIFNVKLKRMINVIRYGEMNVLVGLIWNRMLVCCVIYRLGCVCCGCGMFGCDNMYFIFDDIVNVYVVLYRFLKIDEFCWILIGSWVLDFLNGVYFWIGI